MEVEKPKVLYRGVRISYDLLKTFHFDGYDLTPPNEPKINEEGQKTVGDGNEYGLYMTDNLSMTETAYGKPTTSGKPLLARLNERDDIAMPEVGIIYEIITDGVDIRQPWLASHLRGHYNNGFEGKEWIADRVPMANYSLKKVSIGRDILHDEEVIPLDIKGSVEDYTKKRVEGRRERLEAFAQDCAKIPYSKRTMWGTSHFAYLRDIYGEGGVKYQDVEGMTVSTAEDAIKYLIGKSYKANPDIEKFDYSEMSFLGFLKEKVAHKKLTPEDVKTLIQEALDKVVEKRETFVRDGKPLTVLDKKIKQYGEYISSIDEKLISQEKPKGQDREDDI